MVAVSLDPVFLSIFGRFPDPVLLADNNRRYVFANAAAAELLETPVERLIGMRIDDFAVERSSIDSDWCDFIGLGQVRGSYRLTTLNGGEKHVQFSAVANVYLGFHLSLLRDITVEHEGELQRVQIEQLAELALKAAQMGCWNWNCHSGCTTCNEAFRRLFDIPAGAHSVEYLEFLQRVHPDDLEGLRHILGKTLEGGGGYETQYRVVWRDGSVHWLLDRGEVIFDRSGHRMGISGVAWDVTPQRLLEQERANHLRDLARSNLDLQRFAHVASHDLKEPLRNISALSELLARQSNHKLDDNEREVLAMVVSSAKRMATLIDSMLAYAKAGLKRELVRSPVPAREVVDEALFNLRLTMEQAGAAVKVSDLPTISCARSDIVQVFQNLISNAIKYCVNQPEVKISAEQENGHWVFAVRDNGIGVEPAHREDIFEMFARLHSEVYPGTGVGLAICKAIVEKHGGRIWVEPHVEEGSTFFFTIPS